MLCFFFNDTATTEIYTLSLHDALPISAHDVARGIEPLHRGLVVRIHAERAAPVMLGPQRDGEFRAVMQPEGDRKSTRLNSSHANISYAVFCLKKKKKKITDATHKIHAK